MKTPAAEVAVQPECALGYAIATQLFGCCNKQCKATQWLTPNDVAILREIIEANEGGGIFTRTLKIWDSKGLRRSVLLLVKTSDTYIKARASHLCLS